MRNQANGYAYEIENEKGDDNGNGNGNKNGNENGNENGTWNIRLCLWDMKNQTMSMGHEKSDYVHGTWR